MDVTFDPALVRWEMVDAAYGRVTVLHYDGQQYHRNALMDGMRWKYAMPDEGVIIKASARGTRGDYYRCQSEGDWVVWEALPDELRPDFQPILCYACSRTPTDNGDVVVSWSAQEWCPGQNLLPEEAHITQEMVERAKDHGFQPVDTGYYQARRRHGDRRVVWLDFGAWQIPGEPDVDW